MEKSMVFNIERYATEDGHGIRTVIFLKGCHLRCRWCANPESQSLEPEILVTTNICTGCGRCETVCRSNAIHDLNGYGYITDMEQCTLCGACIEACYMDARKRMGALYTQEELLEIILRDEQYYRMSGGGVTFSGGEPLLHAKMIQSVAVEMKDRGYTTLVETCGLVSLDQMKVAADAVDYIYFDIKQMDSLKHQELTGADNHRILSNLEWLCRNYEGSISVRYPVIPGCNGNDEEILAFLNYVKGLDNINEVIFLPYHRLGYPKYQGLGRKYEMGDMKSLKKSQLFYLSELAKKAGMKINIQ